MEKIEDLLDKSTPKWKALENNNREKGFKYNNPTNYIHKFKDTVDNVGNTYADDARFARLFKDAEGATSTGYFLGIELSKILRNNYGQVFPGTPLVDLLALINDGGFAEILYSKQIGWKGDFAITDASAQATRDPNKKISPSGTPRKIYPHSFDAWYELNMFQMTQARSAGLDLQGNTIQGVFIKYNQTIQRLLAIGEANKIQGLYNSDYLQPESAPARLNTMTSEEIYNFVADYLFTPISIQNAGNLQYLPTHLLLSPAIWALLRTRQYTLEGGSTGVKAVTLSQSLLGTIIENMGVMPVMDAWLAGSYFGETGDRMMMLNMNRDVLYANIPVPLTFSSPTIQGFNISTDCFARIAGIDFIKTFCMKIANEC